MNRRHFTQWATAGVVASMGSTALGSKSQQPNVLIIHTDEQNFRTLGCYRDLMSDEQSFVWGQGVKVETPNIDSLAREGALCTKYYAASPVCTPSRASFVSGLYPIATGSYSNDEPLKDEIITFAELFKRNGYATSYLGKWHLDGEDKPGFAPKRKFGFDDNLYMINRGHWKNLKDTPSGPAVGSTKNGEPSYDVGDADEKTYTTDFLTDRAIRAIQRDKSKPFCIMLSIPDPHGPDTVRKPYDTQFANLHFEKPRTMLTEAEDLPEWNKKLRKLESTLNQQRLQAYFGMVKCIDDNVGKILTYLKAQGLDENTIVIYTSDHGDLMGEHRKHNKGLPYEASAKVPFIIRYPGKVPAGKVVHTPHCNIDFTPMLLSLAGIKAGRPAYHGTDTSGEFLSPAKEVSQKRTVYFTHAGSKWASATNGRYKLVLSPIDKPWLFDLQEDPDEIKNFYGQKGYEDVGETLTQELMEQIDQYNDPIKMKLNT